jgi:hypothetical protein
LWVKAEALNETRFKDDNVQQNKDKATEIAEVRIMQVILALTVILLIIVLMMNTTYLG